MFAANVTDGVEDFNARMLGLLKFVSGDYLNWKRENKQIVKM